jgi:cytochrome c5
MSKARSPFAEIRSPRRALPVVALLAAALALGCGKKQEIDHELSASLIQPVARVEMKVVEVAAGNRAGEQVYQAVCTVCHAGGLLDSPATGNADQWADRIAKGLEANVASAINGLGNMPPRGGGADLTDTEVERAVVYLLNTAGGSFTEPPLE